MKAILLLSLLFLTACVPVQPAGIQAQRLSVAIIPRDPTPIPPGDVEYRIASLQETAVYVGMQATAQVLAYTQTAADRFYQQTQIAGTPVAATLQAAQAQQTQTARMVATQTALAAPVLAATQTALANDVDLENKRAAIRLQIEPILQWIPPTLFVSICLLIMWIAIRLVLVLVLRLKPPPPEPVYEAPKALPPPEPRPQLVINSNEGRTTQYRDLPCSVADMDKLAFFAVEKNDLSLAVNRWEKRGLSGPIDEVREWALKEGYADKEDNTRAVSWNARGVEILEQWRAHRPHPTRPMVSIGAV